MQNKHTQSFDERIAFNVDSQTKKNFMTKARENGKEASELLRQWIKDYLSQDAQSSNNGNPVLVEIAALKSRVDYLESELLGKLSA